MLSRRMLEAVMFLCLPNFFVFWLVAFHIGGDAVSGKAVGGHYFVSNHGHLTEVRRAVFLYSKWHVRSLMVTHPLAFLCAWLASRETKTAN
jgi:hypothetical protein